MKKRWFSLLLAILVIILLFLSLYYYYYYYNSSQYTEAQPIDYILRFNYSVLAYSTQMNNY